MPVNLTRKTILLQSFETAAHSTAQNREVMKIPVAANSAHNASSDGSIFRTTEK